MHWFIREIHANLKILSSVFIWQSQSIFTFIEWTKNVIKEMLTEAVIQHDISFNTVRRKSYKVGMSWGWVNRNLGQDKTDSLKGQSSIIVTILIYY